MENKLNTEQNIARYLSGELDEKNIELMERDLMSDEEKEQQMKDFTRIWEKSVEIKDYDSLNVDSDWDKVRSKMGFKTNSKRIPFRKYMLRIAAILIVALGLVYFLNSLIKTVTDETDYFQVAALEATKEVQLPDNSKLILNNGAKAFYNNNFGVTNRDIILEGEAYFEVQRNEEIPFKVFVESSTVEVLGTSFNIKTIKENIEVSVVTGKVAFYETTDKENRVELVKDEHSIFNTRKHSFTEKKTINQNEMAWRTGMLIFEGGEPLDEVFIYLERFFNQKIDVESERIKQIAIGPHIVEMNKPLAEVLEEIKEAAANEFVIIEDEDSYLIRSNN